MAIRMNPFTYPKSKKHGLSQDDINKLTSSGVIDTSGLYEYSVSYSGSSIGFVPYRSCESGSHLWVTTYGLSSLSGITEATCYYCGTRADSNSYAYGTITYPKPAPPTPTETIAPDAEPAKEIKPTCSLNNEPKKS